MNNPLLHLSGKQLQKAATLKSKIEQLQAQLEELGSFAPTGESPSRPRRKRRRLSKKARAAISAAQKERWAKHRKAKSRAMAK